MCNVTRTIPKATLTKRRRYWKSIRQQVAEFFRTEYGTQCQGCAQAEWTELHHVVPLAANGINDESNIRALCHDCHMAAHEAWSPEDDAEELKYNY